MTESLLHVFDDFDLAALETLQRGFNPRDFAFTDTSSMVSLWPEGRSSFHKPPRD